MADGVGWQTVLYVCAKTRLQCGAQVGLQCMVHLFLSNAGITGMCHNAKLFISLYVCVVGVCVFTCMCMGAHEHICIWKSQIKLRNHLQSFSTLFHVAESLNQNRSSPACLLSFGVPLAPSQARLGTSHHSCWDLHEFGI